VPKGAEWQRRPAPAEILKPGLFAWALREAAGIPQNPNPVFDHHAMPPTLSAEMILGAAR
jgi:hypothetical protein